MLNPRQQFLDIILLLRLFLLRLLCHRRLLVPFRHLQQQQQQHTTTIPFSFEEEVVEVALAVVFSEVSFLIQHLPSPHLLLLLLLLHLIWYLYFVVVVPPQIVPIFFFFQLIFRFSSTHL